RLPAAHVPGPDPVLHQRPDRHPPALAQALPHRPDQAIGAGGADVTVDPMAGPLPRLAYSRLRPIWADECTGATGAITADGVVVEPHPLTACPAAPRWTLPRYR